MWYREGTNSFVKDSKKVTGVGTLWSQAKYGVMPGMVLIGSDNLLYEIERVQNNTELTLVEAYKGNTIKDQPCRIITTYEGDLSQFSARFSALLHSISGDSREIRNWLTSPSPVVIVRDDGTTFKADSLETIHAAHKARIEWFDKNQTLISDAGNQAANAAGSAKAAKDSQIAAKGSETQAANSAKSAKDFQVVASASQSAAKTSETNAKTSEINAANSAKAAAISQTAAKASETNAANSAKGANMSQAAAKVSETNAGNFSKAGKASELAAKTSETNAKSSEVSAKSSEANAKSSANTATEKAKQATGSQVAAKASETNAASSKASSAQSASNASASASKAEQEANKAISSANNAATSASSAASSANSAKTSESNAKASSNSASSSERNAKASENNAAISKSAAEQSAKDAASTLAKMVNDAKVADNAAKAAKLSENNAKVSETATKSSETNASNAAKAAKVSQDAAKISETNAANSAKISSTSQIAAKASETEAVSSKNAAQEAATLATKKAELAAVSESKAQDAANRATLAAQEKEDLLKGKTIAISLGSGKTSWTKIAEVDMPQNPGVPSTVRIELIGGSGYNVGEYPQTAMSEIVLRSGNGYPKGLNASLYRTNTCAANKVATINTGNDKYDVYVHFYGFPFNLICNVQQANATILNIGNLSGALETLPDGVLEGKTYNYVLASSDDRGNLSIDTNIYGPGFVSGAQGKDRTWLEPKEGNACWLANIGDKYAGEFRHPKKSGTAAILEDHYTKGESDGKYQPKGNYAVVGASYTKDETNQNFVKSDTTNLGKSWTSLTTIPDGGWGQPIGYSTMVRINSFGLPNGFADHGYWNVIAARDMAQGYAGFLTGFNNGKVYYGFSNTKEGNPTWVRVYTENHKPSPSELDVYTKGESDNRNYSSLSYVIRKSGGDNTDLNNWPRNRVAFVYHDAANNSNVTGVGASFSALNNNYVLQLVSQYHGNGDVLKFRTRNGDKNSWNPWHHIATTNWTYSRGDIDVKINGRMANGTAYTKGESDGKYQPKGSYAITQNTVPNSRKVNGKPLSSDITLNAADIGAFSRGLTEAVSGDNVPWNAASGVYNANYSGHTQIIVHFSMGAGNTSTPSLQLKSICKNGGIAYRSARDGHGFEETWTEFYTTKNKPSASDVGAYSKGESDGKYVLKNSQEEINAGYFSAKWINNYAGIKLIKPDNRYALIETTPHGSAPLNFIYRDEKGTNISVASLPTETGVIALQGYSYSKAEADGKYQPKGSYANAASHAFSGEVRAPNVITGAINNQSYFFQSDGVWRWTVQQGGNWKGEITHPGRGGVFALQGDSYTKGESDNRNYSSLNYVIKKSGGDSSDLNNWPNNRVAFVYHDAANSSQETGVGASFSALNNNYVLQLVSRYHSNGDVLKFRTKNGDNNTWNPWHHIATTNWTYSRGDIDAKINGRMANGTAYTKGESDGKYQPRGNFQLAGNYAVRGENYTKGESDGRYYAKSGEGNLTLVGAFRRHIIFNNGSKIDGYIFKDPNGHLMFNNGVHGGDWQMRTDGSFYCGGNGNFNDVYIRSDKRAKKDIAKISDATQKLSKLSGYTYTVSDDNKNNSRSAGLIAQEVQKVLPEAVTQDENDLLRLNYNSIIGLLVEAVKDLQKQVDELKN
ncbi:MULTISPECIES: tail fiber domain-containing protein [Xenorhabdus]|uniref:tail fiber domain-containing protein n=1 Tax=Xenorhabdus TaxID=626 RepID=UPI000699DD30|nr:MULTISPECIES: tail fiber domain-containing protein [Xenorhabdus]